MKLGVNIDHIAVLREARKMADPNPLEAISVVKKAGADQITIHLREDRRHINDIDAQNIIKLSSIPVNLECGLSNEILNIVYQLKPHRATLVPERREEVTTEGGLYILGEQKRLKKVIKRLHKHEIEVSLFIDPTVENVNMAKELGVEWIEFHTGRYANIYAMLFANLANTPYSISELELPRKELSIMLQEEIDTITLLSSMAKELKLKVASGHGLNYENVKAIAEISTIDELNIGQSIIARSVWVGLEKAILDMKDILS